MTDSNDSDSAVSTLYFPKWLIPTGFTLVMLAIIFCAGSWIFVYYYRNRPIIAMGQPEFLYSVCFGAILILIGQAFYLAVPIIDKDADGEIITESTIGLNLLCQLFGWFMILGDIVTYTALLCKMYRTMKLTQQPLRRGLRILPRHVLGPYVAIVLITIALLIAWSLSDPIKYMTIEYQDTNATVGFCNTQLGTSYPYYISMIWFIVIVQLVLLILACKIRNINQEIGDSKRIFRLLLFHLVVNGISSILLGTVNQWGLEASTSYTITAVLVILTPTLIAIAAICFLIVPRMYYIWYERKHGRLPASLQTLGGGTTVVVSK